MKNKFGRNGNLKLYNKAGVMIYKFIKCGDDSFEKTYDENGNQLTYKDSKGFSNERTYDENGNQLTYKDSNGFSNERTYDDDGNVLTYKNSQGAIIKRICRISQQHKVVQEFTMEQLVEKVGNFKLIK